MMIDISHKVKIKCKFYVIGALYGNEYLYYNDNSYICYVKIIKSVNKNSFNIFFDYLYIIVLKIYNI